MAETSNSNPNTTPSNNNNWERFLDNYSICTALTTYITEMNHENTKPTMEDNNNITPVKCFVDLKDHMYSAIIDSGASVSIIAHKVVKELGLKIDEPSRSLIVAATGTTS
jgi:hypothetical protein